MHCIFRRLARESLAFGGGCPAKTAWHAGPEGGLEARQWNWGSAGASAKKAAGGSESEPPETLLLIAQCS